MHDGKPGHAHRHKHHHKHRHEKDDFTGSKNGAASGMDKEKLKAVLSYTKEHNQHHAIELRSLLAAIRELDAEEILDMIENSAKSIESAVEQIEQALEVLEEL
jgi:hypothetical protein